MSETILENFSLCLAIDSQTGCFDVIEKETGVRWDRDPFTGSPGELRLSDLHTRQTLRLDLGRALAKTVTKRSPLAASLEFDQLTAMDGHSVNGVSARVLLELAPEAAEMRLTIEDIAFDPNRFSLSALEYPSRQFALRTHVDDGYLAIPYHQGCLVPCGRFKVPLRDDWYEWDDLSWQVAGLAWGTEGAAGEVSVYGWNALSMPWFGAVNGRSAFVAIMEPDYDLRVSFILNYNMQDDFNKQAKASPYPRIAVCSPVWASEKGKFARSRRITYRFFPGGTHVDMAKCYRAAAAKQGLIVTLKEKRKGNPEVEKLFGAPVINIDGGYPWYAEYPSFQYTWKDLKRILRDLHDNLELRRAYLCVWGGYSQLPPKSLPFHPEWGSESELREVVDLTKQYGYLYSAYHGYPANLPHAESFDPEEGTRSAQGGIGGRWGGRCSSTYLKLAQADLPRIVAITGQTADYSDIVTAGGFVECHHPRHPLTRREDRDNRIALLKYIRSLGLVTGSEVAQGYAVPHMDYAKGGMYVGLRFFLLQHIHAPLFNLVFHDCLAIYDGRVGTSRRKEYSNETLECLAYGIQPILSFNMAHYPGARRIIRETAAATTELLRETAQDELVSHEYLGGGYDVQRTSFSSGIRVTVNTDTAPFATAEGLEVPERGFVVENSKSRPRTGSIKTAISVE